MGQSEGTEYHSFSRENRKPSDAESVDTHPNYFQTIIEYSNYAFILGTLTTLGGLISLTQQNYWALHTSAASYISAYTMYAGLILLISSAIISFAMREIEAFFQQTESSDLNTDASYRSDGIKLRLAILGGAIIAAIATMELTLHSILNGTNTTAYALALTNTHTLISPILMAGLGIMLLGTILAIARDMHHKSKTRTKNFASTPSYTPTLFRYVTPISITMTGVGISCIGVDLMASDSAWSMGVDMLMAGTAIMIVGAVIHWLIDALHKTTVNTNPRDQLSVHAADLLGALGIFTAAGSGICMMNDALKQGPSPFMPNLHQGSMLGLMAGVSLTLICLAASTLFEKYNPKNPENLVRA